MTMNDGQWLRHWCTKHAKSSIRRGTLKVEDLARKARSAAERDGFSVEAALDEVGARSLDDFIQGALSKSAAAKA
jgi:hypothetical protein